MKTQIGYSALFAAGIGIIMLLMLFLMVQTQGVNAFNRAQEAAKQKNPVRAAAYYEKTIRWYLPFNKHVEAAIHKLWEIGQQAEEQGENDLAREIYHRLRSSLYAIQCFHAPYEDWIMRCDRKIMAVTKTPNKGIGQFSRPNTGTSKDWTRPRTSWSLAMLIGFWGWILSTIGFIRYGIELRPPNLKLSSLRWPASIIGFYSIWLISLAKV